MSSWSSFVYEINGLIIAALFIIERYKMHPFLMMCPIAIKDGYKVFDSLAIERWGLWPVSLNLDGLCDYCD